MRLSAVRPERRLPNGGEAEAPRPSGIRITLLLALLPAAQAALDRRWLFDGLWRDPWIYYSYFRFAPVYVSQDPDLYFGSRLSVILPGYLLRQLLPAVPANVLLHLALYACALAAFYQVARAWAGRRGALAAGLVLGGQPLFLRTIGSNYVAGFGIVFFLAALAAVTAAAASRRRGRRLALLVAAGAAAAALVSANLFYAIYLPLLAAAFMVCDAQAGRRGGDQGARRGGFGIRWRETAAAAVWAGAGAALAFVGFGAVGRLWGHGRPRFYLNPTIHFLWEFSRRPSIFKQPLAHWGPHAGWLAFPLIVAGGSIALLARRQWQARAGACAARTTAAGTGVVPSATAGAAGGLATGAGVAGGQATGARAAVAGGPAADAGAAAGAAARGAASGAPATFAQLQYLGFFAAMGAVELQSHGVTLEYPYYACLLLPAAALALAGQLAPLVDALSPRAFAGFAAALAAALALAGAAAPLLPASGGPPTILLPLGLGAAAVVVLATGRRGLVPALLVSVSLVAALVAAEAAVRPAVPVPAAYADSSGIFRQIDGTLSLLRRADPTMHVRLWYDGKEDAGQLYDLVATSWRLCRRLVNRSFPDIAGGEMCDGRRLGPGMLVAVLSQRPPYEAAAAAERSLGSIGLRARWLGVKPLPGPVAPLSMSWFATAAAGETAAGELPGGRR